MYNRKNVKTFSHILTASCLHDLCIFVFFSGCSWPKLFTYSSSQCHITPLSFCPNISRKQKATETELDTVTGLHVLADPLSCLDVCFFINFNSKRTSVVFFPLDIPFLLLFLSSLLLQIFLHCHFQAKVAKHRDTEQILNTTALRTKST